MFEPRDDVEARRLCRIYLKLFDAGPEGASVEPRDAIGHADIRFRRIEGEAELVRRLLDDGLLDRVEGRGGGARWALPPTMREALIREVHPGVRLASRLRVLFSKADDGEDGLEPAFRHFEREIRTEPW